MSGSQSSERTLGLGALVCWSGWSMFLPCLLLLRPLLRRRLVVDPLVLRLVAPRRAGPAILLPVVAVCLPFLGPLVGGRVGDVVVAGAPACWTVVACVYSMSSRVLASSSGPHGLVRARNRPASAMSIASDQVAAGGM